MRTTIVIDDSLFAKIKPLQAKHKLSAFVNTCIESYLLQRATEQKRRKLSPDESLDWEKNQAMDRILSHPAIGLWKKRWPKGVSSSQLVMKARKREETRSAR